MALSVPTAAQAAFDRVSGNFNMYNSLSDAKSAYDAGIGSLKRYSDSARNFIAQSALTEQANAHEIEMWKMQNEYNTPAAQMQRLIDAGLNPMLAYQQVSSGNASSAPGTHVPNAKLTPNQDRAQELNSIMSVFESVNGMVQQMMNTVEQTYDLGIKRNEKAWSDLDFAAAKNAFAGFGEGRNTDPRFRTVIGVGTDGTEKNLTMQNGLDPLSPEFSPGRFRVLDRLGITNFYPKVTTAEANAKYAGSREEYQRYFNEYILPLEKDFKEGKVDMQKVQKSMIDYQDKVLEMIPPEYRALLIPVLQYLRPLINTSMRFQ